MFIVTIQKHLDELRCIFSWTACDLSTDVLHCEGARNSGNDAISEWSRIHRDADLPPACFHHVQGHIQISYPEYPMWFLVTRMATAMFLEEVTNYFISTTTLPLTGLPWNVYQWWNQSCQGRDFRFQHNKSVCRGIQRCRMYPCIKLHTKLPLSSAVLDLIVHSEASQNDKNLISDSQAGQPEVKPGQVYIFNKGYVNYEVWDKLDLPDYTAPPFRSRFLLVKCGYGL